MNQVLENVDKWMKSRGLEVAHHKSEAVMLTKKRACVRPRLTIGGHLIKFSSEIRYLEVRLDTRLSFKDHVQFVARKAMASATALAKLMPTIKGPG